MRLARFAPVTVLGTVIGLIGGFLPATVFSNIVAPQNLSVSTIVWFSTAGLIVAAVQRRSGAGGLPRWWLLGSALGWAALTALATAVRGSESMDLRLALPASFLFSLLVGGALVSRRGAIPSAQADARTAQTPGRFSGFRTGAAAIPVYLLSVGVGHIVLALVMSSQATGPRDGQAFSGTFVLGLTFVVLGLFALAVALGRERSVSAAFRGGVLGLVIALAVVGYTASRGYDRGGVVGEIHCVVEQGQEVCPPGDGTWIRDARPDLVVMLLAIVAAYALAHALGRATSRRPPLGLGGQPSRALVCARGILRRAPRLSLHSRRGRKGQRQGRRGGRTTIGV